MKDRCIHAVSVTDASGVAIQHLEYMAFGEVFVDERRTGFGTPYKFNAKELDCESGYYYYEARYYDPRMARFLSVDPAASEYPDWGGYTYTLNNPLRFIDPTGMVVEPAGDKEAKALGNYLSFLEKKVTDFYEKAERKGWSDRKTAKKAGKNTYVQAQKEYDDMHADEQVFKIRMGDNISNKEGAGNTLYNPATGDIDLNVSGMGDFSEMQQLAHEMKHGHQFLNGELGWEIFGNKTRPYLHDQADERAAFTRQNYFPGSQISDVSSFVSGHPKYRRLDYFAKGVSSFSPKVRKNIQMKVKLGHLKVRF